MGSDLEIVNDARVSYDKYKSVLDERDSKLIKFLITNKHTSPLRGSVLKFEVKCPLYIARQWYKHHVASNYVDSQDGWNEVSLRYTEGTEFYVPYEFRKQSKTNKQVGDEPFDKATNNYLAWSYKKNVQESLDQYQKLIGLGVCREQARGLLPSSIYTRFRWTTSLEGVLHFISLRDESGAQWEIQQYAKSIKGLVSESFPKTLEFFLDK